MKKQKTPKQSFTKTRDVVGRVKIEGLKVVPLQMNFDDRGYLFEIVHNYDMSKFGQVYAVGDPVRGVIRAYHKHEALWDYFCIVKGSAKFIFIDDRKKSRTYKQQEIVILSEKSPKVVSVPPGVYHGWMSLEDNTIMISIASEIYNHEKPDEIRIPPDSFGDLWVVKGK